MGFAIGLDIGHSLVKVRYSPFEGGKYKEIGFATLVIPGIEIVDAATAELAKADTVTYNGREYFVGKTAETQGQNKSYVGLSNNWTNTDEHDILFLGALDKIEREIGQPLLECVITVGLPAENFGTERAPLKARLSGLLKYRGTPENQIRVQSQPSGPLHMVGMDEEGLDNKQFDMANQIWGVIEVGHYTTDSLISKRLEIVEVSRGSEAGVAYVHKHLASKLSARGLTSNPARLNQAIMTRKVLHYGKEVDVSADVEEAVAQLASTVVAGVKAKFGVMAEEMNGIVIAGGGAPLLAPYFREIYPHLVELADPRMCVAEGFRRFSMFVHRVTVGGEKTTAK